MLTPLYASPAHLVPTLQQRGHALVSPQAVADMAGCSLHDLLALQPNWNHLPPDPHLKDGGRYRRRRHSCCVVQGSHIEPVPHRAHWQPLEYNALHGGMQRWFEPVLPETLAANAWQRVLVWLGRVCSAARGDAPSAGALAAQANAWYVEAHQFRIDTTDGIGRPTPEGAHRDGVDFVAVFLVDRHDVKGGETRVFEADGPNGQRFTLMEPWSLLLLDDARVIHESTPIQPTGPDAHRDTLVLTYRAAGFQTG